MKRTLSPVVLILSISILLLSCSEEPTDVGINILPPTDGLKIDSAVTSATSDTSFLFRISGSSSQLLVGNYPGPGNEHFQARTLLQFSGFLSVPPNVQIDSAVLKITPGYHFKDSTGTFGFEIHEMQNSWNEATFTWDSSNISGMFQNTADTTFYKSITTQDTVLRIRIDTLVRDWVRAGNNTPYGIIFIPDSLSTNIILGFQNDIFSTAPVLTISYHDTSIQDSLVLLPIQSMFVANGNIPASPDLRYLQSGIAYRSLIRFDSLSSVIPAKASITQAILEVSVDNNASLLNSQSRDSVLAYFLRGNTPPYDSIALATLCEPELNGAQAVFRSDIKNIVQQWVTNQQNYGIVLRSYNEFASLDRFALYGAHAAPSLRPKLKILYTILP